MTDTDDLNDVYNINSYTIDQLFNFFSLSKTSDENEIEETINEFWTGINSDPNETNEDKEKAYNFLQEAQNKLIENNNTQLQQNDLSVSSNLGGDNICKDINYDQTHYNPLIKEYLKRNINVDTQFREDIYGDSNEVTFRLSETVKDVLSIRFSSLEMPLSFYSFNDINGTSFFDISSAYPGERIRRIKIEPGNYEDETLIEEIQKRFNVDGSFGKFFRADLGSGAGNTPGLNFDISLNKKSRKVEITSDYSFNIYFYVDDNLDEAPAPTTWRYNGETVLENKTNDDATEGGVPLPATVTGHRKNNNLGWYLGFRKNYENQQANLFRSISGKPLGYRSSGLINTYGVRYIYVVLEDFQSVNTVNNPINITNVEETINIPFSSCDISGGNSGDLQNPQRNEDTTENILHCASNPAVIVERLTIPQTFTRDTIITENKEKLQPTQILTPSTQTRSILARIPLDHAEIPTFSTKVYENNYETKERLYPGPVNISKLKIILLDNLGNALDLNGGDWSLSLEVKQLVKGKCQ